MSGEPVKYLFYVRWTNGTNGLKKYHLAERPTLARCGMFDTGCWRVLLPCPAVSETAPCINQNFIALITSYINYAGEIFCMATEE